MPVKVWGAGSNQGNDNDWNNPSNWDDDTLPVDGDAVLFDSTTTNRLFTGPSINVTLVNFIINNDYSGNVSFANLWGSATGVIINGGLINYSYFPASGNFSLENCSSFSGVWNINFISRSGDLYTLEPQYFSISNLTFTSGNNIIPASNFINPLEFKNYNDISGIFNSFTVDGVNFLDTSGYTASQPFDFSINAINTYITNNGTIKLMSEKEILIQTENLTLDNPAPEIFPAESVSGYMGTRITFTSSSILNIQVNGENSSRFFSNMRYFGMGTPSQDLSNLILTFQAPSINYNQTGNFHLCISEGYIDPYSLYSTPATRQTRIIFNGASNIAIRGESTVSGDPALGGTSSITCSLYDSAKIDGNRAITAYMYDNSKVECLKSYYYQPNFNGSNDIYVIFEDFYGTSFYQNRKSNKSSF